MTQTAAIWLVIVTALTAANLPFITERLLLVGPVPKAKGDKGLGWRLLEMLLLFFLVGFMARWLEGRVGQVTAQGWEFYAVTGALFLTLAFPGFVYRYLMQRRRR